MPKKPAQSLIEIPLYNNTVKIYFNQDKHVYTRLVDGKHEKILGCSSIVKCLDKPALVPWAAKKVAEKILATVPVVYPESGQPYVESLWLDEFEKLVYAAKNAPREEKEEAGDIGTAAHNQLEIWIKTAIKDCKGVIPFGYAEVFDDPNLDERAKSCVNAALKWADAHKVRWLKTESVVYHKELNYAGTMDGLAMVSGCEDKSCCAAPFPPTLSLIDFKSSNGLWTEFVYQVRGYQRAHELEFGDKIGHVWILRLDKFTGDFDPWWLSSETEMEDWAGFRACLDLTRAHSLVEKRMNKLKKARKVSSETEIKEDWLG